ncbi:MAG: hypothetical protein V7637_1838, partial [Mycobacteriales bacterium]
MSDGAGAAGRDRNAAVALLRPRGKPRSVDQPRTDDVRPEVSSADDRRLRARIVDGVQERPVATADREDKLRTTLAMLAPGTG